MVVIRYQWSTGKTDSWHVKQEDVVLSSVLYALENKQVIDVFYVPSEQDLVKNADEALLPLAIQLVLTYLKHYRKRRPKPMTVPVPSNDVKDICHSTFDCTLLTICTRHVQVLADMMVLAQQWNIPELQDLLYAGFGTLLRGKTLHQLITTQRLGAYKTIRLDQLE